MVSQRYEPDPVEYRPTYHSVQVRAADLDDGDVLWHNNEWRYMPGVYLHKHLADLHNYELSEEDKATLIKYLTEPKRYVVAELRNHDPDRLRDTELLPIPFYDLVTVQAVADRIPRP